MAKRKSTSATAKKAADVSTTSSTSDTENESKIAALVEAEATIEDKTDSKETSNSLVYLDEAGFLPEDKPDKKTDTAKPSKPASVNKKVDGVVVNPEKATTQPENGKNQLDTMGNIKPEVTTVESRAESLGESLQEGEEGRRVAIPGKVALAAVPPQVDMDTATALEKTEAEAEAISTMVNDSLPNKPAPEQVHSEVKADEIITRAANVNVKQKVALQDLPIDQALSSTETPHLDEIPVPAGEIAMTEREQQVLRMQESNMPILRQNSREDIIDRKRPLNVFQRLAEANENADNSQQTRVGHFDMVGIIKDKLGVDVTDPKTIPFLSGAVETLDEYAKRMSPRSPVTSEQILEQQKNLTRLITACFEQEPKVGVAGLQIIEEYFRAYSNGAFGGSYPFRAFNTLPPTYAALSDVLFAIQSIVKVGKPTAMRTIVKQKLKEAVQTQDGQMVLLSYLNA